MPPSKHITPVLGAVAVLLLATPAGAQPFHMDDSLRGGTMGNASGGSFGPDGWTVTGVDDQIWYALPRLASGYVEFTMANVTLDVLPLGDHEMFAMYEDGYGIGEPIHYAPEFRLNHYKILMRIYGTPEPGRAGYMKLMWGICPSGAPGHSECACDSFFAEPFEDPGPWTGAPVRMRVEWGSGTTRMLRDGVEVVSIDWTGFTFGPSDLHMMIGSPRNDGGLSAMPMGATFSDLVVDGMIGPLATCAGGTMDAGVPPGDAGSCDPLQQPLADGTAASWEAGVFPDANDLNVEGDGSGPAAIVYMRFPALAGVPTRATLTMEVSTVTSAGGGSGEVCRVDGTFDETTLTWASRPTVTTTCTGGAHRVSAGDVVTWDVTSLITGPGEPVLALVSTDADGAHFWSRESGGCERGPRLAVEGTTMPPLDAGGGDMDGGGVGRDGGGSAMDATAGRDGGRRTVSPSGCGCRTLPQRPSTGWLGFAVVVVTLLAYRRLLRRR